MAYEYEFSVGDIVEVVANNSDHDFEIGEHVRIKGTDEDGYIAEHLDGSDWWYLNVEEVEGI